MHAIEWLVGRCVYNIEAAVDGRLGLCHGNKDIQLCATHMNSRGDAVKEYPSFRATFLSSAAFAFIVTQSLLCPLLIGHIVAMVLCILSLFLPLFLQFLIVLTL